MIKTDIHECVIAGKGIDIVQDFCSIIRTIREERPEMLAGVIAAWSDILIKDSDTMDTNLTNRITRVAESWIKLNGVE